MPDIGFIREERAFMACRDSVGIWGYLPKILKRFFVVNMRTIYLSRHLPVEDTRLHLPVWTLGAYLGQVA